MSTLRLLVLSFLVLVIQACCATPEQLSVDSPMSQITPPAASTQPARYTAQEFHQAMAAGLFNKTWELLDKKDRTADESDLMIQTAYASRYHWSKVGGPQQWSVGDWQIARVYTVLNRPEPALYHARRSLEIAEANKDKVPPFYRASAHQGLAHALAINNDFAGAKEHIAQARELLKQVPEAEDRMVVEGDLGLIPLK